MTASTPSLTAEDQAAFTFATWLFYLVQAGIELADAQLAAACQAVGAAQDEAAGDAAGLALADAVKARLCLDGDAEIASLAQRVLGERLDTGLGRGSREERTSRIRRYQFETDRPWLARIWERHPEGGVVPVWLLIERVTDRVSAMDPNPWNDIDEERHLPLTDFHVLWELGDCLALSVA